LATGRKPKVVFTETAGQIAGQQGQVIELTDPQLSDEWLVVRFGRDELPFSPADLEMPPKGTSTRRAPKATEPTGPATGLTAEPSTGPGAKNDAAEPTAVPVDDVTTVVVPAPREENAVPASPAATAEPTTNGKPTTAGKSPVEGAPAEVPAKARGAARKAVKPKPPASLTVNLAYTDGEWTVTAQQGTKVLAKPFVIRAAEALKMVAMLDVPGVREAVEEIVTAARVQAEAEADRLRSELADIEARLAELREPA
jgi:hypothetical protein